MPKVEHKDRDPQINMLKIALNSAGFGFDYTHTDLLLRILKEFEAKGGEMGIHDTAKILTEHEADWDNYFEKKSKKQI